MAFVFQADKKGLVSPSNLINPGPGQYTPQGSQSAQGYAPFLSTVERGIDKKKKDTLPGPGSYESFLAIGSTMKPNKTFHATLSPDKGQVDFTNHSTAFKSKTKRFEYKIDSEQPGPGKYYKDPGFGKPLNVVSSAVSLHLKTCAEVARGRALPEDRTVIPSIPSYSHHYGYTEVHGNKLTLNKNPLLEIQQFVGPGYYDTKDMVQVNPNRGTIWHKSSTKRFESHSSNVKSRMHIGPGTYEIPNLDGAQPKYKVKPSSSFASTTNRNFIGKGKPKDGIKGLSKTVDQFAIEFDTENLTSVIVERKDEDDKHEDDGIPGPGRYHNEVWSTSLKTSYKPSHLQFFGSTEDRFKNEGGIASQGLGPGEYNHLGEALKKIVHPLLPTDANKKLKDKPGFRSTDLRFKDVKNPTLGPGVYEPKTTIIDKVKDMARKGYLGSFGSTEIRFRPDKETIGFPEPEKREEEPKKVAHYFASTTDKHTDHTRQDRDKPPPGSYDPDYYDIAKRAQIKESYFSSAKKVPFSTSETRFKALKKENNKTLQPENLMEGDYNFRKNKEAVFLKRDTPSSVFNSKTDRAASSMTRKGLPGPGTYANTQSGWLKKSYNIKFIDD